MQFPIIIGLHRSRILGWGLIATVLLIAGLMSALPQSLIMRGAITMLAAVAACLAWRRQKPTLTEIWLEGSGEIRISTVDGAVGLVAEVLPGAIAHPWLTFVRLKASDGGRHLLIATVDSIKADEFRRLRVFLRWRAKLSEAGDDA